MRTQNNTEQLEKQALNVFTCLAAIAWAGAFFYCYSTKRFMEMGMVGAATVLLALLIAQTYRSFSKK